MSEKITGVLMLKCQRCGKEEIDVHSSIVAESKENFEEIVSQQTPTGMGIDGMDMMFGSLGGVKVKKQSRRVHWCDEWKTELGFLEIVGARIM